METDEEEIQRVPEEDESWGIPAPVVAPDIESACRESQAEAVTEPAAREPAKPAWAVVIFSVWIIGIYVAFYYFLIGHWAVRYAIER